MAWPKRKRRCSALTVKHASTYALKANVSDDFLSAVAVLNSALQPVARGLNQLLKLGPGDYYIRLTRDVGLAPTELAFTSCPRPNRVFLGLWRQVLSLHVRNYKMRNLGACLSWFNRVFAHCDRCARAVLLKRKLSPNNWCGSGTP